MSYKGKYVVKNPEKYVGDVTNVVWRSLWERIVMVWLDANKDVEKWSSETVLVPYVCATDGKVHRYYIDFFVEFRSGKKWIVEVKPDAQTRPPKTSKKLNETTNSRTRMKILREAKTYAKNSSKWEAATAFAEKNGLQFIILTEKNVEKILGLRFIANGKSVVKKRSRKAASSK